MLCAYMKSASLNINSPNIMKNPSYYESHNKCDSQDMVSPSYGHHDCTILYPIYNLNCKHRTSISANYNKYYAFLLIVPCYDEKKKYYDKKLNSTTYFV